MDDRYEIEYSFICTKPETLEQLRKDYEYKKIYKIADSYYDLPNRSLSKNKYVFRQRVSLDHNTLYTIKGPASGTNPPKRLELETESMEEIFNELKNRFPEILKEPIEKIQGRITQREEYHFPHYGFVMYIDNTEFYDNDVRYVNIEVEGDTIEHMNEFKKQLLKREGIREWKPSKFQVGEAVKALSMTGDLSTAEDFHKIEIYLENKEKNNKK